MSPTEPGTPTAETSVGRTPWRRIDAVLGPPVWWACHFGAAYWLVPRTCVWGGTWPLHALTVVVLALLLRAGWSATQLVDAARSAPEAPGARRDLFLGRAGLGLAVFFAAVTVAEWTPVLFIDPCW